MESGAWTRGIHDARTIQGERKRNITMTADFPFCFMQHCLVPVYCILGQLPGVGKGISIFFLNECSYVLYFTTTIPNDPMIQNDDKLD